MEPTPRDRELSRSLTKGMVGEETGLDMEQSINRFRPTRNHSLRLADVAAPIIDTTHLPADLDQVPPRAHVPRPTPNWPP